MKPVLAIETSDVNCGVSIYFSAEKFHSISLHQKNSHSEGLLPSVNYLFNETGVNPNDLEYVAISEGPGSFTGLRIGMSAAKGIAMGAGIPVLPVPTFEAFAFQIAGYLQDENIFVIANKVNKDEVYYARFQVKSNNYIFAEELTILTNDELIFRIEGVKTFGNASNLGEKNITKLSAPLPEYIAMWAEKFGAERKTFNYNFIEPNYLKNFQFKEKKK
ncbi:MAG TPA: tRNA (adenosine(37)-N6)-threonylcarbamoyltransferase complex dimerization subunit type 1 TsaB [Ignavibacteriaceae bacterium]